MNDRDARVRGVPLMARLFLACFAGLLSLSPEPAAAQSATAPPQTAAFPSLAEALARAEQRAPGAIEARGEVAVARAGKLGAEASAFGNPYVDFQVDRGSSTKDVQALAYLYMPVDAFGQRGARIDEADALVRWKGLSAEARRSAVRGETIARWGAARVAQERLAHAQDAVESAEKEATYFAGRFAAKDTTIYEKSLAEAEVGRWMQARAEAELDLIERLARLSEWTGESTIPSHSSNASLGTINAPLPPAPARRAAEAPALVAQRAEHFFGKNRGNATAPSGVPRCNSC